MTETTRDKESGLKAFYRDSTILVTGATGFLGILLIEKLLRSCSNLKKIYILIRPKKGKSIEERLEKLFNDPVYSTMKQICPKYEDKVIPIAGDCAQSNLGLSDGNIKLLQEEVNIVFHCAATVRFDEELKTAVAINIRATRDLLKMARNMKNLQAFVHVSTAYSHCPRKDIDEVIYDSPMETDKIINLADTLKENVLEKVTPEIIRPWPNTYAFTKAIGESVIKEEGRGLPICILRPSMVINANNEPLPGWVNNVNGPVGPTFGAAIGILHTVYLHCDEVADMVPADYVINSIIAAAWSEYQKRPVMIESIQPTDPVYTKSDDNQEITVYNYVSSPRNPITWGKFVKYCENFNVPSDKCVWYYSLICTKYYWLNAFFRIFLHYFPALLVDIVCLVLWRKPIMLKAFKKIHKFLDITAYFHESRWEFSDKNIQKLWYSLNSQDKEIFPFDITAVEWYPMLQKVVPGLRFYFLKDPIETLERGIIKYQRLKILHYVVVTALYLLLFRLLWKLVGVFI